MAKKIFKFYGKETEDIQNLSIEDFAKLVPSRQRRSIKRGFTEEQKKLLKKLEKGKDNVETHCRELIILPSMLGKTIKIYNGKSFEAVKMEKEMLGHRLGEYSLTRRMVKHSAPGVGATKSSSNISVK